MPKLNIKASRPKSKAEILQRRRDKAIFFNHTDLVEELVNRNQQLFDESSSDSEGPEEISTKRPVGLLHESDDDEKVDDGGDELEDEMENDVEDEEEEADVNDEEEEEEEDDEEEEQEGEEEEELDEDDVECDAKKVVQESDKSQKFNSKKRKAPSTTETNVDDKEGIFEFKMADVEYKIVALDEVRPLAKSSSRKELLRKSTRKGRRMQESGNLAHVDKWRKVY